MSYGPTIETIDDWNTRLDACGCCEMPACPVPSTDCERFSFQVYSAPAYLRDGASYNTQVNTTSWTAPADISSTQYDNGLGFTTGPSYVRESVVNTGSIVETRGWSPMWTISECGSSTSKTFSVVWTGSHVSTYRIVQGYYQGVPASFSTVEVFYRQITIEPKAADPSLVTITTHTITRDYNGVISDTTDSFDTSSVTTGSGRAYGTRNTVQTYEDEHTYADAQFELDSLLAAADLESCSQFDSLCDATITAGSEFSAEVILTARILRFRFEVPDAFGGSYFAFTWDEVFFPEGYNFADPDDVGNPTPTILATDQTAEWIGPGDGMVPASWFTHWIALSLPTGPGTVQIRNLRYICYRSPYGQAPTPIGNPYPES